MKDHQPEQSNAAPEAEESVKQKGLSPEAWAAVSAIAVALISGAVAIMTTTPKSQNAPPSSGSASPSVDTADASHTADAIAGKWSGEAKTASGEFYTITVDIRQSCRLNEKCGTINVLPVPCYGEISLKAFQNEDYEFDVSNFDDRSSATCTPGAGEHFKLLSDERLSYRADWGVQGTLDKVR